MVRGAAFAQLVGADPIEYLQSTGDELHVRNAVYQKAYEIQMDQKTAELKALHKSLGAILKAVRELGRRL